MRLWPPGTIEEIARSAVQSLPRQLLFRRILERDRATRLRTVETRRLERRRLVQPHGRAINVIVQPVTTPTDLADRGGLGLLSLTHGAK